MIKLTKIGYLFLFTYRFDLLVNGGGSVTLNFQRNPFQVQQTTVMVPWNQMVSMDTVLMLLEREEAPSTSLPCLSEIIASEQSGSLKPVVLSTWQHTQLGACPKQSTVIPESQVRAPLIELWYLVYLFNCFCVLIVDSCILKMIQCH